MARTRTMTEMVSDLRIAADIVNRVTRHPTTQLERWLNESIQRLREIASDNGHEYYLKQHDTGGITSGAKFAALPDDFLRMYGVDVIDGETSWSLEEYSLRERNNYGGTFSGVDERGPPSFYRLLGKTATGTENICVFMPRPDRAYSCFFWYLPVWADITGVSTFDGVAGWEDWVKWDCCCKVAARDKNDTLYNMAAGERAKLEALIVKTAPRRNRTSGGRRLDTRMARIGAGVRSKVPGGWP